MLGPGGPHSARPERRYNPGGTQSCRPDVATHRRPRSMNSRSVTIPGPLVPYLRAGLKREISSRLAILQGEIDTDLDPETYSAALARLWPATAVFELIGLEDQSDQPDVEVDLSSSARLLLKALETQHRIEVQRLQDAAADGVHLPQREVPELGALVSLIRQKTCARSPHRPGMRRKGDG